MFDSMELVVRASKRSRKNVESYDPSDEWSEYDFARVGQRHARLHPERECMRAECVAKRTECDELKATVAKLEAETNRCGAPTLATGTLSWTD